MRLSITVSRAATSSAPLRVAPGLALSCSLMTESICLVVISRAPTFAATSVLPPSFGPLHATAIREERTRVKIVMSLGELNTSLLLRKNGLTAGAARMLNFRFVFIVGFLIGGYQNNG